MLRNCSSQPRGDSVSVTNTAAGELERQVETLGQPGPDSFADRDPIDDGLDRVRPRLGQLGRLVGDLDHLAVDSRTDQAGAADRLKDLEVLPLAVANQRGQDLDFLSLSQASTIGSTICSGVWRRIGTPHAGQ